MDHCQCLCGQCLYATISELRLLRYACYLVGEMNTAGHGHRTWRVEHITLSKNHLYTLFSFLPLCLSVLSSPSKHAPRWSPPSTTPFSEISARVLFLFPISACTLSTNHSVCGSLRNCTRRGRRETRWCVELCSTVCTGIRVCVCECMSVE